MNTVRVRAESGIKIRNSMADPQPKTVMQKDTAKRLHYNRLEGAERSLMRRELVCAATEL